jgi:hypothetical protein
MLAEKISMPNESQNCHEILDCGSSVDFTLVGRPGSSSLSTTIFSHLSNIEGDSSHAAHPGSEAAANITPFPTGFLSRNALTKENLNTYQQQMANRKDEMHNGSAALGPEQGGREAHMKLVSAALSLGIPLFECFMKELINWHEGIVPLERFTSEDVSDPFSPDFDRLQALIAGDVGCGLILHEGK